MSRFESFLCLASISRLKLAFVLLALAARLSLAAELQVEPKPAAKTLSVVVLGVDGTLQENVEAFLQIMQLADSLQADPEQKLPTESRLRWLHARAEQDIQQALQPFGYYRPTIDARLESTPEGWLAEYTIKPGPPLSIAELDVRVTGPGADDPAFRRVLDNLPLQPDAILEHPKYEEIKQQLQAIATERGYFDARMPVSQILVDLEAYQARIKLELSSGERYRYGPVSFEQDTLRPELLQRYVRFKTGDPYFAPDLLALQSDLINSQYFDQVLIDADPDNAIDKILPITVKLSMRKSSKYTFGLGYGTDTGVRLRADIERRWVTARGHRMDMRALASQVKSSLDVVYKIPAQDPRRDALRLSSQVAIEDSDIKQFTSGRLRLGRDLQLGQWTGSYGLEYLWEEFEISDDQQTSQLLGLVLDLNRLKARDNRLQVKHGYSLNLQFYIASDTVVSDISLLQVAARSKWITSWSDKHRLITRAQLGTTWISDEDFEQLPTSLRFFAGGDNSIRGYALDVVGPRDDEGDVIGGRHLVVGSLEYEYRLFDQWSLAAFVDSGDAFDNDTPEFKTGVGVGLRWQSPVGPIRVDLAHGLEDPGDDIRLHFNIGPDL